MDDLKKCPFCDGHAEIFDYKDSGHEWWWVSCDDCGMESDSYKTKARAIAAWNTRASEWTRVENGLPIGPFGDEGIPILVTKDFDGVGVMYLFDDINWKVSFAQMGYTHWQEITLPEVKQK